MNNRPAERLNSHLTTSPLALPISQLTDQGIQRLCDFLQFESGFHFKPIATESDGRINVIVSVEPVRSTSAAYIVFSKKVEAGTLVARHIGQYEEWAKIRTDFDFDRECVVIDSVSGRVMGLPHLDPPAQSPQSAGAIAYMRRRRDQTPI